MNPNNTSDKEKGQKPIRAVDKLVQETYSWLGRRIVFIRKTKIKTWQGIFIIAFCAGLVSAIILTVSFNVHIFSRAQDATLYFSPSDVSVVKGDTFDVDILINTDNDNVVAVKAVIEYDTNNLSLESWDTTSSVFADSNACVYNSKPCEIVNDDPQNGKITITLAKPSPGIKEDSGIIVTLNFRALNNALDAFTSVSLDFDQAGSYDDSDVIIDDGRGTDILFGASPLAVDIGDSACTDVVYSDWSICADGFQTRTIKSTAPEECVVENPVLTQECGPVDTENPRVINVTSGKANRWYRKGVRMRISVKFSEPVTSSGDVTITLETGTNDRSCTFSINNAISQYCVYKIQKGDRSTDLNVKKISGDIKDASQNPVTNFTPQTNLAANKNIKIDGIKPTGSMKINSGKRTTRNRYVNLYTTASDQISGVTQMRISNDGKKWTIWKTYRNKYEKWNMTSSTFGGSTKKGTKRVRVQVRDRAGNVSSILGDTIIYW